MTLRGIQTTAQGLAYYQRLQEVVANNLANVSTTGFKLDRLTGEQREGTSFPTPVQATDFRQGPLRDTGRPLDLALEGDGWFVVRAPGGERLTRAGSFRLDGTGQLVDAEGHPVLGTEGPVAIPPGTVEIQADGTLLVDSQVIATLRLERPAEGASLAKEGFGRFAVTGGTEAAGGALRVRQGMLEDTNADAVSGMIDLVTIQRAYSANIDALKAMDGVLETVTTAIGKV